MNLRPYQTDAIEAIWAELFRDATALCQGATGMGKTEIMIGLIKKSIEKKPDIRVVVMMGRVDLINQTDRRFRKAIGVDTVGVYCGSLKRKETDRAITILSAQSAKANYFPPINMVIVDEVHRLDQKGGDFMRFINNALERNPRLKIVGFTATPWRADGLIYGETKFFKRLCYQKTIQDMIELGFLCTPILKQGETAFDTDQLRMRGGEYRQEDVDKLVDNEEVVRAQVREALARLTGRTTIAWATSNIEHCSRVTDFLTKEGENATQVHSKQDRATRDSNLHAYLHGTFRHMVFVSILSEGFDHPPIDAIVGMRPTRSPVLYVQTVGRGLRISPDKANCLYLDYGQVVRELGPLDAPKIKGQSRDFQGEAVLKLCSKCKSWVPGGCLTCPDCGTAFPAREKPETKLTDRPDHTAEILSGKTLVGEPETTQILGPLVIAEHTSKSGNVCVRLTYQDRNLLNRWGGYQGVSEYYVKTNQWAMNRLSMRLAGFELRDFKAPELDEEVEVPGSFEIVSKKEGKYDRVISVMRVSEESPGRIKRADEPEFEFTTQSGEEIGF